NEILKNSLFALFLVKHCKTSKKENADFLELDEVLEKKHLTSDLEKKEEILESIEILSKQYTVKRGR
ncbi:hypothetical protein HDU92_007222, partial [Lobulomyces angularis]